MFHEGEIGWSPIKTDVSVRAPGVVLRSEVDGNARLSTSAVLAPTSVFSPPCPFGGWPCTRFVPVGIAAGNCSSLPEAKTPPASSRIPFKPADTSSPRATLQSFIDSCNEFQPTSPDGSFLRSNVIHT